MSDLPLTPPKSVSSAARQLLFLVLSGAVVAFLIGLFWSRSVLSGDSVNDTHITTQYANLSVGVVLAGFALAFPKKINQDAFYDAFYALLAPMRVAFLFLPPSLWECTSL